MKTRYDAYWRWTVLYVGLSYERGEVIDFLSAAGEEVASESSDIHSDDTKLRHHLLRHKLTLDKETGNKAEPENEAGQQETERKAKRKRPFCKQMYFKKRATWRANDKSSITYDFIWFLFSFKLIVKIVQTAVKIWEWARSWVSQMLRMMKVNCRGTFTSDDNIEPNWKLIFTTIVEKIHFYRVQSEFYILIFSFSLKSS